MRISSITDPAVWPHVRAVLLTDHQWYELITGEVLHVDDLTGEVVIAAAAGSVITTLAAIAAVRVDTDQARRIVEETSARRRAERMGDAAPDAR